MSTPTCIIIYYLHAHNIIIIHVRGLKGLSVDQSHYRWYRTVQRLERRGLFCLLLYINSDSFVSLSYTVAQTRVVQTSGINQVSIDKEIEYIEGYLRVPS